MHERHLGFTIGDVFHSGDELAEWIVTLAIAENDASFAGSLVRREELPGEWIYAVRLSFSHFTEIAKYLELTERIPTIQGFVSGLTKGSQEYADVLTAYRKHKRALHAIRDTAAFHYPAWRANRRPMTRALADAANSLGLVRLNHPDVDNRLLFADEVVSAIVAKAAGGKEQLQSMVLEISRAIASFAVFSDAAIDRYLTDHAADAADYGLIDPDDQRQGWRRIESA